MGSVASTTSAKRSKNREKLDKLAKDFQFEDSDITIISSDDVRFAVHRYQLQATR